MRAAHVVTLFRGQVRAGWTRANRELPCRETRRVFGERQCRRFDIAPAFGRVDAFAPTGYRSGHLGRSQRYPKLIQVHRVGILVPHSAQVLDQILLAGLSEGQAVDG